MATNFTDERRGKFVGRMEIMLWTKSELGAKFAVCFCCSIGWLFFGSSGRATKIQKQVTMVKMSATAKISPSLGCLGASCGEIVVSPVLGWRFEEEDVPGCCTGILEQVGSCSLASLQDNQWREGAAGSLTLANPYLSFQMSCGLVTSGNTAAAGRSLTNQAPNFINYCGSKW